MKLKILTLVSILAFSCPSGELLSQIQEIVFDNIYSEGRFYTFKGRLYADAIALGQTLLEVTSGEIRQEGMSELVILYLHTGQIAQAQTLFESFQTEYPGDLTVHELLQDMLDDATNKNFAGQAAKSNVAKEVNPQTLAAATETPMTFAVEQNYPNPFNPETVMKYSVGEPAQVTLKIYNLLGQEIRALVDEMQTSGSYQIRWDGKDNLGRNVASGIYVYRLRVGEQVEQKKMTLLR